MKRQAAVVTGKGEVKMVSEKLADLKEHEVLIKVHASLISPGTEIASVVELRKTPDLKAADRVFGYANAGEIIKVKGDVKGLKAGMRVAAMGTTGAHHANYANVPVNMVVPIPDGVTYEQAVYACLGATSLQAIRRTVPELGEYGIVLGLGIVGNLAAQLAQLSGARVVGWEGFDSRIKIAKKCGIRNRYNHVHRDIGIIRMMRTGGAHRGNPHSRLQSFHIAFDLDNLTGIGITKHTIRRFQIRSRAKTCDIRNFGSGTY
jgi:NADPH:quinone reductase-like Zn-dependent oxidoreductase